MELPVETVAGGPDAPVSARFAVGDLAAAIDPRLRRLHALQWRDARRLGLSSTSLSVLGQLRRGPQRITELAEYQQVAQPSMTRLVNRLEERGWVTRVEDPDDGRTVLATLSTHGREVLAQHTDRRVQMLAGRIRTLSEPQRAALAAALPALDELIERWKKE